jgi:hypothetical protein
MMDDLSNWKIQRLLLGDLILMGGLPWSKISQKW